MFLLTRIAGGVVVVSESREQYSRNGKNWKWPIAFGIYAYVTLLVFMISTILHARDLLSFKNPSSTFTFYVGGLVILICLVGWSLSDNRPFTGRRCKKRTAWLYPFVVVFAVIAIVTVSINPIKADTSFKHGLLLKDQKQIDQAIAVFRQAIALAPGQDIYHAELGRTLLLKAGTVPDPSERIRLFEESSKSLDRARGINPRNAEHYLLLGYLLSTWGAAESTPEGRSEKLNRSLDCYKLAAHYDPQSVLVHTLWAKVLSMQGDFEGALRVLSRSLSIDSGFGPTYLSLGAVYLAQGRLEEAEKAFLQGNACGADPSAKPHTTLAYLALEKGDLSAAEDSLLKSLRLDPDQPAARSALGLVYYKSGQLGQALEENLKALQLLPGDPRTHNNLVLIYREMGRTEEALMHAHKALDLSPDNAKPGLRRIIDQLEAMSRAEMPE
jgi:tetratricopeptide (TPR) repeat protein